VVDGRFGLLLRMIEKLDVESTYLKEIHITQNFEDSVTITMLYLN
jgi:hypothetical protein